MKCRKFILIFTILVFIIVFFISCYIILKDLKELEENNKSVENLIDETIKVNNESKEKEIDWNYLKLVNEDIIAWIEIKDTNINYPILKDKDNYYLKHSFDKKYNSNGSIFTTNITPFEDKETIIYGHNMRNNSMFSNLEKYLDENFLYSHLKFKIYTPKCNYEATIFSVYSIDFETEINNIKLLDFNERLNYYKNASKYKIDSNKIEKIIKLSTCSYINAKTRPTNQRYYIIANLCEIN